MKTKEDILKELNEKIRFTWLLSGKPCRMTMELQEELFGMVIFGRFPSPFPLPGSMHCQYLTFNSKSGYFIVSLALWPDMKVHERISLEEIAEIMYKNQIKNQ